MSPVPALKGHYRQQRFATTKDTKDTKVKSRLVVNRRTYSAVLGAACLTLAASSPARAQLYESVGIRAQGMGGAFVAVADDSSSTWWNPAGLATGAYFSAIVEHRTGQGRSDEGTFGVSLAVPSLGLSYYRVRMGIPSANPTESTSARRQDQGTAGIRTPSFVLRQFGATVGQSLGEYLVIASTLKLVRADQTRGDLDVGAMVRVGSARFAITAKHVVAPDLTADGNPVTLDRQVRVGAAYAPAAGGSVSVIAAVDADLTTTRMAAGDERHLAGGAELHVGRRVGLRGGVSINTIADLRRSFSGGASAGIASGFYIDAQMTRGDDDAKKGWGFDLRVTF